MNVNDFVWVKLTDRGRAVLRENYQRAGMDKIARYKPPVEVNGWARFRLFELMYEFGRTMHNALHTPFEGEIRLVAPRGMDEGARS